MAKWITVAFIFYLSDTGAQLLSVGLYFACQETW